MNSLKIFAAVSATAALLVVSGCSSDSFDGAAASSDEITTSAEATSAPSRATTPASVCSQIEDAGIGKNCAPGSTTGLAVAATSAYDFDLPSVPVRV